MASLCEMETKARQTLSAARVHTIRFVPYLSYARQIYKISRQQGQPYALINLG
jgi:phosphoribosylpyrophosphate synthetase